MEFGLREVLIGVGLLVIAGILFDGFRRMRRS
ncbi:MAG: cell division protein ZipA, partial [Ketobacteraceae bacterium]|nr:cell division protein ZipA [Ketobacteraceae bacterium]